MEKQVYVISCSKCAFAQESCFSDSFECPDVLFLNEQPVYKFYQNPVILAADYDFTLVYASFGELSRLGCRPMLPKPGKYISASGAEVYVDDNGEVVQSADEVVSTLDLTEEEKQYLESGILDADEILENRGLVF